MDIDNIDAHSLKRNADSDCYYEAVKCHKKEA